METNPLIPLTQQQIAEISKSEYFQHLQQRVQVGAAKPETFERYHIALQKRFFDEDGVNRNPLFIITCTKNEYNPRLGDYRHTLENQGYNVKVLHDPTAKTEEEATPVQTPVLEPSDAGEEVYPTLDATKAKVGRPRKNK